MTKLSEEDREWAERHVIGQVNVLDPAGRVQFSIRDRRTKDPLDCRVVDFSSLPEEELEKAFVREADLYWADALRALFDEEVDG